MNRFLVLRDAYGSVQLRIDDDLRSTLGAKLKKLSYESAIRIEGIVCDRGADRNADMQTGDIEIGVRTLEVVGDAPSALPLTQKTNAQERTRLAHRHLDIRTPKMQQRLRFVLNFSNQSALKTLILLRLRSNITHKMRRTLVEEFGFVEIETPTLTQWTPGGAHEYAVPAGKPLQGAFYSLPQSPQIFKQLLMCGGIDRYFQV